MRTHADVVRFLWREVFGAEKDVYKRQVHAVCNLGMGTEIMLDHPEFIVFAPCRIAIYEKPDACLLYTSRCV